MANQGNSLLSRHPSKATIEEEAEPMLISSILPTKGRYQASDPLSHDVSITDLHGFSFVTKASHLGLKGPAGASPMISSRK